MQRKTQRYNFIPACLWSRKKTGGPDLNPMTKAKPKVRKTLWNLSIIALFLITLIQAQSWLPWKHSDELNGMRIDATFT